MSCDWNVEDVSDKSFHFSIIDETTIVLLADLGLKLNFYVKDFQHNDSQKVYQLD